VCGSFEVLADDGSVIARVEGQHFAVDLLVEEHATGATSSVSDRDFFAQRGARFEAPAPAVHEAVLRDGDRVTLSGPARDVLESSGFRGSRSISVFRGEGSYPITVRAVPSERVRVALDTPSETENDTHDVDEAQGSNDVQALKR
jgi:hypothetical protein